MWDVKIFHLVAKGGSAKPGANEEPNGRGTTSLTTTTTIKRQSFDPKVEKFKQEQDGIVLSPQRKSFNAGCQASQVKREPERPEV
jgi:hypothetical protein